MLLNESLRPSDDEPFWTDFLARAKARQGSGADDDGDQYDKPYDSERSIDKKPLWVVVVKVGQLIAMTFLVAHPPSPAMRNIRFFGFTSV